ncbi:hypothetical protein [Streptomyces melanogenes]|uniref:hypothetical protein n=1 Tax=Streptomyces melanogenes TaxID=67326 RepID=UPI0019C23713|nr:hypothetical protein GCM10010278_12780 [Streptomyces melanogenes]
MHIPPRRGRRSAQPFVIVVPEAPSLAREAFGFLGRLLWRFRGALAPTGFAVLALVVTALLHLLGWWSGAVLVPLAAGPVVWFAIVQSRHPARRSALVWRIALAVLATLAGTWVALAAWFGPLAGPLALVWLITLIAAQSAWLIVRRTH